jgi:septal ring factor EnvC (AmiA/AmiB activator)
MALLRVAAMVSLLVAAALPVHAANLSPAPRIPDESQRLAKHQAELLRLQRDVARQEADSARAGARLQQQDKTIAELQRQLQALEAASPSARH